jgi:polysaccharide deacetylase family protein (PEP-CTERM system associated)
MTRIRHHFTVDVEEYFHVTALEAHLPRNRWTAMESRIELEMDRLLDLMADGGVRGTFFVLGIVARARPDLVRRVARDGHEVASHGWDHTRVGDLTPDTFRDQVRRTRELLAELSGQAVEGYRAPSFSITRGREWALEILVEEGHTWDSSLYPVRRPGYGYAGGTRCIHTVELEAGSLVEVPPAVLRLAGVNVPVGGGGSFRHLPYWMTRMALRQAAGNGEPGTLYLHPWELDPEQPRVEGASWLTRLRHYGSLRRTGPRLERLFREFEFQTIGATLDAWRAAPSPLEP